MSDGSSNIERIADSPTVTVLARLAMLATPLMMAGICFFGLNYLDSRFGRQDDRNTFVETAVRDTNEELQKLSGRVALLDNRTTSIEAARSEARRAADSRNDQVLARLGRMEEATVELAKQVAALTAVMQQQARVTPRS